MRYVIIGNGIAGNSAAFTIRALDNKAEITIISGERHPLYSACVLAHYVSGEIERKEIFLRDFPDYSREEIQLTLDSHAVSVDVERKKVYLQSGRFIDYDKLIISTGSRPVVPPIKGRDKIGVFTFKSVRDADRICSWDGMQAVVVGSGPVGIEITLALKKRGYRVWLVELLNRILPRSFDAEPSSMIKGILEKRAIEVLIEERVIEISGEKSVTGIITDKRMINCDTVVFAAGMKPDVDLVQGTLATGGLGGITVSEGLGTNVPDIYACGDCVEAEDWVTGNPTLNLLWHNARWQGEMAGYNVAGIHRKYPGSLNVTGLDLFEAKAVSIGKIIGSSDDGYEVIERTRDGRYKRLILQDGVLKGVQAINWSENMGLSLAAILKKEKVKRVNDLFSWKGSLFASSRCHPFLR